MTSYKKIACCAVVLLLSLPLFGQYSSTYSFQGVDILNSSITPYSGYSCDVLNCWVNLTSSTEFKQLTVSVDDEVQAIDGSGNRWHWVDPSWVELSDSIKWQSMHVGSLANGYYIGTQLSTGVAYSWNGSSWVEMGGQACIDAAVNQNGDSYCVGPAGNVWSWPAGASAWTEISNCGCAAAIAANVEGAVIIEQNGDIVFWNPGTNSWTQMPSPGFAPKVEAGAIGWSDDHSIVILGSGGNYEVSHNDGLTFTAVHISDVTTGPVADGNRDAEFVLDPSNGQVYHLNTVLPQITQGISGSCGSACPSGSQVEAGFFASNIGNGTWPSCPSGWSRGEEQGDYCYLVTAATTNLNTSTTFSPTNCDAFAPAGGTNSNCSTLTLAVVVTLVATGATVFDNPTNCECQTEERIANQKYYVLNNYNSAPNGGITGWIGSLFDTYSWSGIGLQQFCTNSPLNPFLPPAKINTIIYKEKSGAKPTAMPGRYVNGDVPVMFNAKTGLYLGPLLAELTVYYSGGVGASIYTWNNTDTQERGPGGEPTKPCQGSAPL